MNTEETQMMLQKRNHQLSRFWIEDQQTSFHQHPELIGKHIVIIDA